MTKLRRQIWLTAVAGAIACAAPLHAQDAVEDVAPAAAPTPAPATPAAAASPTPEPTTPAGAPTPEAATEAPSVITDLSIHAYYEKHPGTLVWLRNAATREGAARLAAILRRAPVEGLDDGPALAAEVEGAIARSQVLRQADEDKIISNAWVRYVRAIKAPVAGISYGDAALELKAPTADAILSDAAKAPSLVAHLDQAAAVNPFYSTLREAALKQDLAEDPRVRATLNRLRVVPAGGRAILVDVANAEIMLLEDGRVVDTMKAIVGKQSAPTPLLVGTIHYVTFNPYWHIPQDVARRTVVPLVLKRGTGYLKLARYETVSKFGDGAKPVDPDSIDWKAAAAGEIEVNIRQKAGGSNMMGAMKFGFVNDQGIFLHDTPHKKLFARARRNLSLGCVRVERAERLARWLLGRDPVPPNDGTEQLVPVDKGVPIYISYLTARPDGEQLAFAEDVYGLDRAPEQTAAVATTAAAPD